ncbi:MAG: hypothetical protein ACO3EZ_01300 [Prochlorotrichaceae cyanobacterium]
MRQLSFLLPEDEHPESVPEPLGSAPPPPNATVAETIVPYTSVSHGLESPPSAPNDQGHPFPSGTLFSSPGGHFTYRVIGPCCRLFDREELPWPCCRLQWRGKEPSWRRIGRRFVLDMATRNSPSYSVEILELGHHRETIVMTLYAIRLTAQLKSWWYAKPRLRDL